MHKVRSLCQLAAVVGAVALLATGCGMFGSSGERQDAPPSGTKMTVGIKFDQPGLGMKTGDGQFKGLDVDVARYVAKELGVDPRDIDFVEAKSGEREAMLEQKKVDFIVASYSITDARKQKVSFAGPYFVAGQSLLVRKTNTDITGPDSLDYSDWKLCSVSGSTPAQKVKESYAKSVTLQEFSSYSECVNALQAGEVDAITTDDVILAGFAATQPDKLKVVGDPFSTERYGIGLPKGNEERRAKVTAALRKMISDGSWKKFVQANIGKSGYQVPKEPEVIDNP